MRLSRVTLEKQGKLAILQGMIHIGPDSLYESLQKDIDWAVGNNYQVFFEGTKKNPSEKTSTDNESRIEKLFLLLFDLYPIFGGVLGISLQQDKIAYPKDAINADITFGELIRRLDENGFSCNLLFSLFTLLSKEDLEKVMKEDFAKRDLDTLMNDSGRGFLGKFLGWFFFRKAYPILLDYRNEVAIDKVKKHSNGQNAFIHYGEKHINGLTDLLKNDGWVVKETTYLNLAEFH